MRTLTGDEVVVEVSTDRDDCFRAVSRKVLREIAKRRGTGDYDLKVIDEMRDAFYKESRPVSVSRTSEADFSLVLDGSNEAESWMEILEDWVE
jgi:hypothetical protein